MKAAIANAVTTFAQAASSWRDVDTATIETLRRELHDARNRLQVAQGALELIGKKLGLPSDATPPEVLAEVMRRMR